jgi:O-antigen/teichoic acid export membrane protein
MLSTARVGGGELVPNRREPSLPAFATMFRSMLISASGAGAGVLFGVLATKIVAVMGGPPATGALAAVQQVRQTATVAASFQGHTAVVRGIARGNSGAFIRTAALMMLAGSLAVGIALEAGAGSPWGVHPVFPGALALITLTSTAALFLGAILNGQSRITRLTLYQASMPATLCLCVAMLFSLWQASSVEWKSQIAVLGSCLLGLIVGFLFLLGSEPVLQPGRCFDRHHAAEFLRVSSAIAASAGIASASLLFVRGNLLRDAGLGAAGLFDASWTIGTNALNLVLVSLQACYLPELCRVGRSAQEHRLIRRFCAIVLSSAVPVLVLTILSGGILLTLFFSEQYSGAEASLTWILMGGYWKVSSWVLAIPVLARGAAGVVAIFDLVTHSAFAIAAWRLTPVLGSLNAAGSAYLLMYLLTFALVLTFMISSVKFRPAPPLILVWLAGLACVMTCGYAHLTGGQPATAVNSTLWLAVSLLPAAGTLAWWRTL